jgi:hypothetical protein
MAIPFASETRRKTLIMMPAVAIVGAALGATIGRSGELSIGAAMAWFAVALCVSSYVSAILESLLIAAFRLDPEGMSADAVALLCDAALGALTAVFLSAVASVDILSTAGAASAILFLQTLLIEKIVLGNAIGNAFVALLSGGGGSQPEFSRAESLAARGDIRPARASYEDAIRAHPKDVRTYVALARMLRLQARDYAGACHALTRALERADMNAGTRETLSREIAEMKTMLRAKARD